MHRIPVSALLLAVLFGTLLVYWPGLDGPFILDDIGNFENLRLLDKGASFLDVATSNNSGALGRSVAVSTFAVNYLVHGLTPFGFKLVNLLLHGAITLLIFGFIRQLLSFKNQFADKAVVLALAVAALWAFSPINVSTVLYAVQRMTQLAMLFTLAAVWFYLVLRGRMLQEAPLVKLLPPLVMVFVCGLLGLLSKENTVLLPYLLFVLEVTFISGFREVWRERQLRWGFGIFALLPAIAALIYLYGFSGMLDYSYRDFSMAERLLSQARILWMYIGAILLPSSGSLGVFHDDFIISRGLLDPVSTILAVLAWIVVLALLCRAWKAPAFKPIAGAIMFFICAHALESSIFPLEMYFEHRNYLPAIGIWLALALPAVQFLRSGAVSAPVLVALLVAYLLVTAIVTNQRALTWSSRETLVESAYLNHPRSVRLTNEMLSVAAFRGDLDAVEFYFEKARALDPASYPTLTVQRFLARCLADAPVSDSELSEFKSAFTLTAPHSFSEASFAATNAWQKLQCEKSRFQDHTLIAYQSIVDSYRSAAQGAGAADSVLQGSHRIQHAWAFALYSLGGFDLSHHLLELLESTGIKNAAHTILQAHNLIAMGESDAARAEYKKLLNFSAQELRLYQHHVDALVSGYQQAFGRSIR